MESRCIISITRSCYIFYCNRPFLSSKSSHFKKEAKCKTRLVKMWFICMRINSFALSLALKQRLGGWDWVGVVLKCIMGLFWGTNSSPVALATCPQSHCAIRHNIDPDSSWFHCSLKTPRAKSSSVAICVIKSVSDKHCCRLLSMLKLKRNITDKY